ncbi:sel1 repeat family protein [Pseudoxanthomonas sp. Root65]|uniref:sel1 repeat family protein n=1 Tax=Pseudoxanthomonas sp. Root65 TaxID=1736576 RepID=UPI000A536853|nr:sel1 repeat family protein [Pseudoxanthomonas sp. Root65]
MSRLPCSFAAACLALAMSGMVQAQPSTTRSSAPDPMAERDLAAAGFFESHPDLKFRGMGMQAYREGDHGKAATYFDRAARFADKPSQAMLAEMRWEGLGVPLDRALAYAWMDLAAERGYPELLAMRERYWDQLDAADRERALALGEAVYAQYGDAVAKPRIETQLRRDRRRIAGSRTGFAGNAKLFIMAPGAAEAPSATAAGGKEGYYPVTVIDGTRYYAPDYWAPERYHVWQAQQWQQRMQEGHVEVGDPEDVGTDMPPPLPQERPLRR